MADLPVLEWDEGKNDLHADVAELGVVKLMAWRDKWCVSWADDGATGSAQCKQDAREKARRCAKTLLQQTLAQLDRRHNAATGLVERVPSEGVDHG